MGCGSSEETQEANLLFDWHDSTRINTGFHTFDGRRRAVNTEIATRGPKPTTIRLQPTQSILDEVLIIAAEDYKSEDHHNGLHSIPQENIVDDISEIFEYLKQLGNGASCRVLKARHKQSGDIFAVKEMSKSDESNRLSFTKEYHLLRKLVHPVCCSLSSVIMMYIILQRHRSLPRKL